MHSSSINFTLAGVFSALIAVASCIATVTHHWSALKIPADDVTPLTTATGGYEIRGSYHAGLFQFCMDQPSAGHFKTCYGITMPMNFKCEGPDGDIIRSASSLYLRLTLTRVAMIVSILIALSAAIVCFIGIFKKKKTVYLWCAMALSLTYALALTSACVLYGYTEGYWYKCGHNQCGGMARCLFSFGYSYGLAITCMILSFFVVSFLWSMRRGLPVISQKNNLNNLKLLGESKDSVLNINPSSNNKQINNLIPAQQHMMTHKSLDGDKLASKPELKSTTNSTMQPCSAKAHNEKSNVVRSIAGTQSAQKSIGVKKDTCDSSDFTSSSESD